MGHNRFLIVTVIEGTVQPGRHTLHAAGHIVYFNGRNSAARCMARHAARNVKCEEMTGSTGSTGVVSS